MVRRSSSCVLFAEYLSLRSDKGGVAVEAGYSASWHEAARRVPISLSLPNDPCHLLRTQTQLNYRLPKHASETRGGDVSTGTGHTAGKSSSLLC